MHTAQYTFCHSSCYLVTRKLSKSLTSHNVKRRRIDKIDNAIGIAKATRAQDGRGGKIDAVDQVVDTGRNGQARVVNKGKGIGWWPGCWSRYWSSSWCSGSRRERTRSRRLNESAWAFRAAWRNGYKYTVLVIGSFVCQECVRAQLTNDTRMVLNATTGQGKTNVAGIRDTSKHLQEPRLELISIDTTVVQRVQVNAVDDTWLQLTTGVLETTAVDAAKTSSFANVVGRTALVAKASSDQCRHGQIRDEDFDKGRSRLHGFVVVVVVIAEVMDWH